MAVRIKWSNLLNIAELDFIPGPQHVLQLSDEITQSIAWLTAATGHDRRLLRCNEHGALLTGNAWDNLAVVENDELYPAAGVPDSFTATSENKGVLVTSSTEIIKAGFVRVAGGATENIYLPPAYEYFYPHPTYSVTATVVPATGGTASYVGITTFS